MVKFPRTNLDRKAITHIRLLSAVSGFRPWDALGFEYKVYRCGSKIAEADLPNPAIVLESAGCTGPRNAREVIWILWRFDFTAGAWIEIARAQAPDWTWAIALRPIARSALYGDNPPQPDLIGAAHKMVKAIDAALADFDPQDQAKILSVVAPEIESRCAEFL